MIASDELLARYILAKNWFHKKDGTVTQNAFIPDPNPGISVTRHINLSQEAIWSIGRAVAVARTRTLYGRADIAAVDIRAQQLNVEADSLQDNPNHANIVGWPIVKDARKAIALELASVARFVANP